MDDTREGISGGEPSATSTSAAATSSTTTTSPSRPKNELASLDALPAELLCNIASKLIDIDDFFALRLTCREVELKTLHPFGLQFFGAKCFMFTTESLQVLLNIANSEKLSDFLQHVLFITANFFDDKRACGHSVRNSRWNPTMRQRQVFNAYKKDQDQLRKSGGDKQFLLYAFAKLQHLKKLSLVDSEDLLPDETECRGMNKMYRTTRTSPSFVPTNDEVLFKTYHPWLSHVWSTMMHAVAESGITTISRLEARFNGDAYGSPMGLSPIDLKFPSATVAQLTKAFVNLDDLSLSLRSFNVRAGKQDSPSDHSRAEKAMKRFCGSIKHISKLKLEFDSGPNAGPFFTRFTDHVDLTKLTTFHISGLSTDRAYLANVVCNLVSVEFLSFYCVELIDGSWVPILQVLDKLPKLDHLHLLYLQQARNKVYLLEQDDPQDGPPSWFDLDGEDEEAWSDDDGPPELLQPELLDENPDLIPQTAALDADGGAVPAEQQSSSDPASSLPPAEQKCQSNVNKDYAVPGVGTGERGYYVCLQGQDQIHKEIPRFIKEYNVGGEAVGEMLDAGGLGNILQQLTGALNGGFGVPGVPNPGAGPGAAAPAGNPTAGNNVPLPPQGAFVAPPGMQGFLGLGPMPMGGGGGAGAHYATFAVPVPGFFGNGPPPAAYPNPAQGTHGAQAAPAPATAVHHAPGPSSSFDASAGADFDFNDFDDEMPELIPEDVDYGDLDAID